MNTAAGGACTRHMTYASGPSTIISDCRGARDPKDKSRVQKIRPQHVVPLGRDNPYGYGDKDTDVYRRRTVKQRRRGGRHVNESREPFRHHVLLSRRLELECDVNGALMKQAEYLCWSGVLSKR